MLYALLGDYIFRGSKGTLLDEYLSHWPDGARCDESPHCSRFQFREQRTSVLQTVVVDGEAILSGLSSRLTHVRSEIVIKIAQRRICLWHLECLVASVVLVWFCRVAFGLHFEPLRSSPESPWNFMAWELPRFSGSTGDSILVWCAVLLSSLPGFLPLAGRLWRGIVVADTLRLIQTRLFDSPRSRCTFVASSSKLEAGPPLSRAMLTAVIATTYSVWMWGGASWKTFLAAAMVGTLCALHDFSYIASVKVETFYQHRISRRLRALATVHVIAIAIALPFVWPAIFALDASRGVVNAQPDVLACMITLLVWMVYLAAIGLCLAYGVRSAADDVIEAARSDREAENDILVAGWSGVLREEPRSRLPLLLLITCSGVLCYALLIAGLFTIIGLVCPTGVSQRYLHTAVSSQVRLLTFGVIDQPTSLALFARLGALVLSVVSVLPLTVLVSNSAMIVWTRLRTTLAFLRRGRRAAPPQAVQAQASSYTSSQSLAFSDSVQELVNHCTTTMGLKMRIRVHLYDSPGIVAESYSDLTGMPHILLSSTITCTLDREAIFGVVAHEVGHIYHLRARFVLWWLSPLLLCGNAGLTLYSNWAKCELEADHFACGMHYKGMSAAAGLDKALPVITAASVADRVSALGGVGLCLQQGRTESRFERPGLGSLSSWQALSLLVASLLKPEPSELVYIHPNWKYRLRRIRETLLDDVSRDPPSDTCLDHSASGSDVGQFSSSERDNGPILDHEMSTTTAQPVPLYHTVVSLAMLVNTWRRWAPWLWTSLRSLILLIAGLFVVYRLEVSMIVDRICTGRSTDAAEGATIALHHQSMQCRVRERLLEKMESEGEELPIRAQCYLVELAFDDVHPAESVRRKLADGKQQPLGKEALLTVIEIVHEARRHRKSDVEALQDALNHRSERVRVLAACQLGTTWKLISQTIARGAAEGERRGWEAYAILFANRVLVSLYFVLASDPSGPVRAVAAQAIGDILDEDTAYAWAASDRTAALLPQARIEALSIIARYVHDADMNVRMQVLATAKRLSSGTGVSQAHGSKPGPSLLRPMLTAGQGDFTSVAPMPALAWNVESSNPRVKEAWARYLGGTKAIGSTDLEAFSRLLKDSDPELQGAVLRALGKAGQAARPLVLQVLHEAIYGRNNYYMYVVCVSGVLQNADKTGEGYVGTMLTGLKDKRSEIRIRTARLVTAMTLPNLKIQTSLLSMILREPSWQLVDEFITALASCIHDAASAASTIKLALDSPDGEVRCRAARTCQRLVPIARRLRASLEKAVRDSSGCVRNFAVKGLAKIDEPAPSASPVKDASRAVFGLGH